MTSEILIAARAKVEQGWCQGSFHVGNAYCVIGAIRAVRTPYSAPHDYSRAVLALRKATRSKSLLNWNDRRGRTQAHVLKAFDKAIKTAKRDEAVLA